MITVSSILMAMTAVSGIVDAVSFLVLGRVFTANMTGNVVFLGFAIGGVPGLSIWRSLLALVCFMSGALLGGCSMGRVVCDREESLRRPGRSTGCNDEKRRLRRQTPMSREILGIHHITAIRRRSATHES